MAKNIPWDSRITWYYYMDRHTTPTYTVEDFEKEAEAMRSLGINIVLLSNKTHFRFNFYPYWDRIVDTLGKITKAFHKHGIKVVEHHSCSLTHAPMTEEEWLTTGEKVLCLTDDGQYRNEWDAIKDWIVGEPEINGVKVADFLQIHGGTHDLSPTQYNTRVVCYNNQAYRDIYFKHLEDIYQTGVDGIMTDDVQFFAGGNACACPTCRRMFEEQTGYRMPETTDEWNNRFMNNYSDPRFVAFDQFRRDSAIRFQRDVDAHFRSLGLNLLRPNYISNEIQSNYSAYPFSNCADLWDVMFQENVSNSIIKESWPFYACEAVHRYAFAAQNDIPSMSMFYCNTPGDIGFSFALCLGWGQLFNPAYTRTGDMVAMEGLVRNFEKAYPQLVYDQQKQSDAAVYFSMKTRDLTAGAVTVMGSVMAWLQAFYFTQKTPDFVLEEQGIQDWQKHKIIILPHVHMMSDEEILRCREFVHSGGTLVWTGRCGKKTPEGFDRTMEEIRSLLGCKTLMRANEDKTACVTFQGETLGEMTYDLAYNDTTGLASIGDDVVIAKETLGKGTLLFIGAKTYALPFHGNVSVVRDKNSPLYDTGTTKAYCGDILAASLGKLIDYVVNKPKIKPVRGAYMTALYRSKDKSHTIAHLIQVGDTLSKEKGINVHMNEPIKAFEPGHGLNGNTSLKVSFACDYFPSKVRLLTFQWPLEGKPCEKGMPYTYEGGYVTVRIPNNTFSGYLMVDASR